jgi:hypothetical protein
MLTALIVFIIGIPASFHIDKPWHYHEEIPQHLFLPIGNSFLYAFVKVALISFGPMAKALGTYMDNN